jgi:hypothetical protein
VADVVAGETSSILGTVSRFAAVELVLLASLMARSLAALPQSAVVQNPIVQSSVAQSPEDAGPAAGKEPNAFFSGAVVESTEATLVVSRTVLGKKERHSFAVTSDTKVEGRLRTGSRVTVRYAPGDSGDSAILIVVRSGGAATKKK